MGGCQLHDGLRYEEAMKSKRCIWPCCAEALMGAGFLWLEILGNTWETLAINLTRYDSLKVVVQVCAMIDTRITGRSCKKRPKAMKFKQAAPH